VLTYCQAHENKQLFSVFISCQIIRLESKKNSPAHGQGMISDMQAAAAYLHSDTYFHAIDTVEDLARTFDPAAPDDLRTKIIEALGSLGIWPMGIFTGQDDGKVIVVA
jgi:hypothetical protein